MTLIATISASDIKYKTITFKCKEISCKGCQAHISESVNTLEGIKSVEVSIENKTVKIEFDENKVTIDKIKEAIEEAGYSPEEVD